MRNNKSVYIGWAIHTGSKEGHGYIGRYWLSREIPIHMLGHRTALFQTRKEARQALPKTRRGFPNSRVVKVKVVIRPTREDS